MSIPDIHRVSLIGAGNQGPKIAFRCAIYGVQATFYDINSQALYIAKDSLEMWLKTHQGQKNLSVSETDMIRARLIRSDELEHCLHETDLVIEAVPEKLDLKKRLFQ